MARLIDKDALIQLCDKPHWCVWMSEIDDFPEVDAVEVIRCHNCEYHEPCKPYNKVWCPKIGRYMKEDGFCSEGVMKDG